ncbi:MAG: helix-turn-helix domain-containing protein [Reichenbachiella sp.]
MQKSIAVLPFVNMSTNGENEFFCDGITEEIINALAKITELRVTSRTSSFFFKGKNIPITDIGEQLSVSTVLEGSVRWSGSNMRITAQLIQADEDFHFWSETWDRQVDNIFEVQDEVSLDIAEKLREHFGHFEIQEHLVVHQTNNLDAYTLFLKGRYHLNKWNPEDVNKGIAYFQQALELDPKHPHSLVGLADSYSFLATTGFISFEEGWGKSAELTQQALAIDDQLPGAYYQLANLAFFTTADYAQSFSIVQKAIAINPNHVESQQFIAFLFLLAGKKKEAKAHLDLALKVDPLSQETQFYNAYLDYMLGDYQGSLSKLDACLEVNPKNIPVHSIKANCLLMLGQADAAIQYFDHVPSEIIVPAEKIGNMALGYVLKKEDVKADQYFQMLEEFTTQEGGFAADVFLLLYYAQTGQNDQAFEWIKRAMANHYPLLLLRFADPLMNPIKDDPRYTEIQPQLFPPELFLSENNIKVKKALLDEKSTLAYKKKLIHYIEQEKSFLNPDMSLRTLAEQLDILPNQLSWLLNESIGKNFNEFINHYRVEAFKQLAKDPTKSHITVIGLAYESGFNSKTVFNTYFKKETGLTPKAFIKGL